MKTVNLLESQQIAIQFFMNEGMKQFEAIEKESENCYCVIEFEDFGINDRVGAFIKHLDNMGELKDIPQYLHKYLNFDRWFVDFLQSGGQVEKVKSNTYIIIW